MQLIILLLHRRWAVRLQTQRSRHEQDVWVLLTQV